MPEEVARQYRIIAAERHGRKLVVATADPLNVVALDDLRRATGLEVDFRIGPGWAIQEAIEKTYRRMVSTEGIDEALRQDLGLSVGTAPAIEELVDIQQLRTQADDPPVVKVVNYVLSRAAADGASDIHVEAYEDRTRVRYRIDGLLFDLLEVPRSLHLAVVSRLKIISRLDIAERRLPQDGSFASHIHDREIDFRVSTLPTIYGEKVVLRLLEKEAVVQHYTLENLGFEPEQLEVFLRAIRRPWGMVLLTGPTGSGKSTTLHTAHQGDQVAAQEHHHGRGPGGVPPAGDPAGAGEERDRLRLLPLPPLHPAPGPGHHHGRRDPRPRDGADRGAGRAHGPPRAVDAAHQRRDLDAGAAHQYRRGPLPGGDRGERRRGPAAGQAHLPALQGGVPALAGGDRRSSRPARLPSCSTGGAGAGSAATSAMRGAWRSTRCSASTPRCGAW